jgi:hypothetical protein
MWAWIDSFPPLEMFRLFRSCDVVDSDFTVSLIWNAHSGKEKSDKMNYSKIHLENNSGLSLHKGQHMNEENMI